MADSKIFVGVEFDENEADKSLQKIKSRATRRGKEAGDSFSSGFSDSFKDIGKLATGVGLGNLAADFVRSSIGTIRAFATDSVNSFKELESANKIFAASLEGTRASGASTIEAFRELGDELERNAGIDDKLVLKTAGLIQSLADLDKNGLKRATIAAADLSAAMQISFEQAGEIIAKVASGGVEQFNRAFKRYGVTLDENLPKQEALNKALSFIEGEFGGRAQKNLTDYEVKINKLSSAYESLTEATGQAITSNSFVKGAYSSLTLIFDELAKKLRPENIQDKIKDLNTELENSQKLIAFQENQKKTKGVFFNQTELDAEIQRSKDLAIALDDVRKARTLSGPREIAQIEPEKKFSDKQIGDLTDKLKGIGLNQSLIAKQKRDEDLAALTQAEEAGVQTKISYAERRAQVELEYQQKITEIRKSNEAARNAYEEQEAQRHAGSLEGIFSGLSSAFEREGAKMVVSAQTVARGIQQGLGNAIGNGFAKFGQALVVGENAFKAFGEAFLQTIGQMAVQQGTAFILQGIGYQFVPGLQGVGGALIGAGAALAVFGGALSALSGGSPSAAKGSGGADGNAFTVENPQIDQQERLAPNTSVSVIVQGDVFDSEETGLRISRILKDSQLNNNVNVLGVA